MTTHPIYEHLTCCLPPQWKWLKHLQQCEFTFLPTMTSDDNDNWNNSINVSNLQYAILQQHEFTFPHDNDDNDSISCRRQEVVMHGSSWWGEGMEFCAKPFRAKTHLRSWTQSPRPSQRVSYTFQDDFHHTVHGLCGPNAYFHTVHICKYLHKMSKTYHLHSSGTTKLIHHYSHTKFCLNAIFQDHVPISRPLFKTRCIQIASKFNLWGL